jgi:hypothetical protein
LRFCENDGAASVVDRAELAALALALLDDWMVNATTTPPWRRWRPFEAAVTDVILTAAAGTPTEVAKVFTNTV